MNLNYTEDVAQFERVGGFLVVVSGVLYINHSATVSIMKCAQLGVCGKQRRGSPSQIHSSKKKCVFSLSKSPVLNVWDIKEPAAIIIVIVFLRECLITVFFFHLYNYQLIWTFFAIVMKNRKNCSISIELFGAYVI